MGTTRRLLLSLLAAALIAAAGGASWVAAAAPPTLSLDYRTWTFRKLGFPADTFRPQGGFDEPTFVYRLPAAVKEGGAGGWWIISLHLRIRTRAASPGASAIIGASGRKSRVRARGARRLSWRLGGCCARARGGHRLQGGGGGRGQ